MSIKRWPRSERPREKLLNHGVGSLSDAELLAIFLQTGVSGRSAVDVARDALEEFGGLSGLLSADAKTFCKVQAWAVRVIPCYRQHSRSVADMCMSR